jgi:hypothetical protein
MILVAPAEVLAETGQEVAPAAASGARYADASGADDDARYEWLLIQLSRGQAPTRNWWTIWVATYGALAAGQGAAAWLVEDEGLRVDAAVGAIESALGLVAVLLAPRTAAWAAPSLRAMDAGTPEAKRKRRMRAEELLRESASEQTFATSWLPHVAAAATNLAGSFVLIHYYDRQLSGWLNLAGGTAIAELQIWTHPTGSIDAWNCYKDASKGAAATTPISRAWSVMPAPGGFVLRGSF